ncbi:uncharacterized protein LOC122201274 [Panthera leo]|uniref:uncharacterized protein LOC122201274 n=1 Tax=Panthera leo TaxID=9689 RepID=UPI001C69B202|nr:uncharacterized protein LOC122201274 [Panthera leo]
MMEETRNCWNCAWSGQIGGTYFCTWSRDGSSGITPGPVCGVRMQMPGDGEMAGRSQEVAYTGPNVPAVTKCLRTQMRMPARPSWEPWKSVQGAPWRQASRGACRAADPEFQPRVAQARAEHHVRQHPIAHSGQAKGSASLQVGPLREGCGHPPPGAFTFHTRESAHTEGSEQPGSRREEKENGGRGNPSVPGHTGPILCNGE